MNKRIYLSPPHLTGEAMCYLKDAVESNWIAPAGPHVDAFEEELKAVLNTENLLAVNSGTSAIHLGLLALGVGKGDEVICSTFTFCASVNPIIYCGATPVFVDSEKETWNMDPDLLENAIQDRAKKTSKHPKVIIVVHLYGMPAQMDRIMEISVKYNIPVLEDSAEALGSYFEGQQVGTIGEVGILSFNGNKIITTSGGGALFSPNKNLIEKACYLRQEAKEPLPYYEHKEVGFNYRLSNLLAALGRSQLKVLQERVIKKRDIFKSYVHALEAHEMISFQPERHGVRSNRWLTAIIVSHARINSEKVRMALGAANIESRPLWKPMHLQPVFKLAPYYGNRVSEGIFKGGLCLPSGSNLTKECLGRVVEVITRTLRIEG